MQVLRDPQIISGFIYEDPVAELPEITHCGEALCCRGHALPPHRHPGFDFLYLSRGSASWQVGGKTYQQGMGDLLVLQPQEVHRTGPKPNQENQHIWIGLQLDQCGAKGAALARQLRRAKIRVLTESQDLEPILRLIIAQVVARRHQRAKTIRSLVAAFIALVGQRLQDVRDPLTPQSQSLPYSAAVQRALSYMNRHTDRRLPLKELAGAALARSAPHFCTQFRREVGLTPGAHHIRLRLEAAREALRQPAFAITTVAHQFGFSSSQHFSTAFRRAFAVTPRQWQARPGPARFRTSGSPPPS